MFNWFSPSLTRKIGGLSAILLSFLFLVIIYSVHTLQQIDTEMREVAEIDIPLTDVMDEVEILQLHQHLLMEKVEYLDKSTGNQANKHNLIQEFNQFNQQLSQQLDNAVDIVRHGLNNGNIRVDREQHRTFIKEVEKLHQQRQLFEQHFLTAINATHDQFQIWQKVDEQDLVLDSRIESLLKSIENLTEQIASYTEKHERDFLLVNSVLGISALLIGIYLTLYIIQTFRQRIGRLQGQVQILNHSIKTMQPDEVMPDMQKGDDELTELESELKRMMERLSQDLTDREEIQQHLLEIATRDKLTNAYNRHKWDEQIEVELKLAARGSYLSLLLLDVDHFKTINDKYGHDAGDEVLRMLVSRLRSRLRATDHIYRLGGEEFAILLRQIDLGAARVTAEAIRQHIAIISDDNLPAFTVSIGVSCYEHNDDADTLFKRADNALYKAKMSGRNRVEIG
ncbi:GGDEF domain-containing protein [Neptunicella marina]|uniref:diguanylate cyclase n=1 Tax=Neptunicella marina TaxID=2125989 RepID=A0A8J6M676_9ALTE|nr:GGDEF domain-containing protein [Neptunicella marina]MBC3766986.1 GGDEF domain-containing protein [Neptunicella marina]